MANAERIRILCSHLTPAETFADVGCDHGYMSEYMLKNGLCGKLYFSDVSKGSLEKAKKRLATYVADGAAVSAEALKEALDGTLGGRHTLLFANEGKTVKRAASFCGAGADEEAIAFAAKNGADALISSDFKHHILKEAVSRGMAVIAPTHYASENYGFYQFYLKVQKIAGTAGVVCEYFENSALL